MLGQIQRRAPIAQRLSQLTVLVSCRFCGSGGKGEETVNLVSRGSCHKLAGESLQGGSGAFLPRHHAGRGRSLAREGLSCQHLSAGQSQPKSKQPPPPPCPRGGRSIQETAYHSINGLGARRASCSWGEQNAHFGACSLALAVMPRPTLLQQAASQRVT